MMEVMDESSLEEELEEADKVFAILLFNQKILVVQLYETTLPISRHLRQRSPGTLWVWESVLGQAFFSW